MLSYPVYFPSVGYRGADLKKRAKAAEQNRLIRQVADYVNKVGIKRESPTHQYLYVDIARQLGLDAGDVKRLCMVDGGNNGFTVLKPGVNSIDEAAEIASRLSRA